MVGESWIGNLPCVMDCDFRTNGVISVGKIKFPHDGDENRVGVGRFFLTLVSLAFAVYMIPGLWGHL